MKHLYENEKDALSSALRKHRGIVKYLGDYIHKEIRPRSTSQCMPAAEAQGPETDIITTYNILLEYGECDLDEFFIDRTPPVLANETRFFWERLFEVAKALERIHNLTVDSDGMVGLEYYG
jgi:hypothetical protein